ncbi:MAG TPA: hypothetical protein VK543_02575 [Puia sp.]|nr:hypothetical protein [Puia sp.]
MKKIPFLALLPFWCILIRAEINTDSIPNLTIPGVKVSSIPMNVPKKTYVLSLATMKGEKIPGFLYDLQDSSLQIVKQKPNTHMQGSPAMVWDYPYQQIDNIRLRKKGSIGSGVLIGILGGAVVGALIGSLTTRTVPNYISWWQIDGYSTRSNTSPGAAVGVLAGGIAGALAGILIHRSFIIKGSKERFLKMHEKMMNKLY